MIKKKINLGIWIPFFFAFLPLFLHLRSFLSPMTLPARGDPSLPFQGSDLTPEFAIWARLAIHALKDQGVLPLWNPYTHSGSPLFEIPQAGSISLSSFLGFLFSPEAAIKWSMLIHVGIGLLGTYFFCLSILQISAISAAAGSLAFGFGTFLLDHFRVGHLNQIYPLTFMPWTLLAFWKSISVKEKGYRWAIASGLTVGIQILEGADNVLFYEMMILVLVLSSFLFVAKKGIPKKNNLRTLIKIITMGALTAITSFVISAFQLIPMISYLPTTGRTGCLPWEFSSQRIREVTHPYPGPLSLILMTFGLYYLWKKEKTIAAWITSGIVLSVAIAVHLPCFEFFWSYLPGFCYQRLPGRALVLIAFLGPLALAAGFERIKALLSVYFPRYSSIQFFLGIALALELYSLAPQMPPMASPQNEIQSNHAMNWLKSHSGPYRIHIWETSDRHWGTEHVTVPLGLEVIAGYTSSENQDYFPFDFLPKDHRTYFQESYHQPARLWGLLNVKYVLSTQERLEPGFHLAAKVQDCPVEICQPKKSSGPWIYENEKVLPKAYGVRGAIAVVGEPRASFETVLEILQIPEFDPRQIALIQVEPGEFLPPVDLIIQAKESYFVSSLLWGSQEAKESVRQLAVSLSKRASSVSEDSFSRPNMNEIDVAASSEGWHVVSERIGLFPGWSAQSQMGPISIYRANGVLGAYYVPTATDILFRYEPFGLRLGLWILVGGILIWLVAEIVVHFQKNNLKKS